MAAQIKTAKKTLTLQEQKKRDERIRHMISYFILGFFSIIFIIPFLYTIATSFKLKENVFDKKFIPVPIIRPIFWNFTGKQEVARNAKPIIAELQKVNPSIPMLKTLLKKTLPNIKSIRKLKTELKKQMAASPADFTKARKIAAQVNEDIKGIDYDGAFYAGSTPGRMPLFAQYYINSIFVSSMITFLQLLTCSLAAFAFARLKWPGRDGVFLGYLGTMMVPGVVMMIPVFILFKYFHFVDTYAGLILPGAFSAYGTFMLRQYFLSIPTALEEAAVIDGANRLQVLFSIIIPLSKTALSTLGIFTFLFAWNDFMWPLIVINRPERKTLTIGLQAFISGYGSEWQLLMAASLIVVLPLIIIFIFGQKYITKGIVMTGLK